MELQRSPMHLKFHMKILSARKNYRHDKGVAVHIFITQMYSINL
jgi:hypothetical protein